MRCGCKGTSKHTTPPDGVGVLVGVLFNGSYSFLFLKQLLGSRAWFYIQRANHPESDRRWIDSSTSLVKCETSSMGIFLNLIRPCPSNSPPVAASHPLQCVLNLNPPFLIFSDLEGAIILPRGGRLMTYGFLDETIGRCRGPYPRTRKWSDYSSGRQLPHIIRARDAFGVVPLDNRTLRLSSSSL